MVNFIKKIITLLQNNPDNRGMTSKEIKINNEFSEKYKKINKYLEDSASKYEIKYLENIEDEQHIEFINLMFENLDHKLIKTSRIGKFILDNGNNNKWVHLRAPKLGLCFFGVEIDEQTLFIQEQRGRNIVLPKSQIKSFLLSPL